MLENLLQRIKENGGFMRDTDVTELAELDRLRQVLVRCNCGRFVCAAQDVAHFVAIIKRDFDALKKSNNMTMALGHLGADYVRDVSLLASDRCYQGHYGAVTPQTRPQQPIPTAAEICDALQPAAKSETYVNNFREEDCGGAFDGFGVTSDADPGL